MAIFVWAEHPESVVISVTVAVAVAYVLIMTCFSVDIIQGLDKMY